MVVHDVENWVDIVVLTRKNGSAVQRDIRFPVCRQDEGLQAQHIRGRLVNGIKNDILVIRLAGKNRPVVDIRVTQPQRVFAIDRSLLKAVKISGGVV